MNDFLENDVRTTWKHLRLNQAEIRLGTPKENRIFNSFHVNTEDEFVEACRTNNGKYNIYVGVNQRTPNGTQSKDVSYVGTLLLDFDAIRPKNTNATEEQLNEVKACVDKFIKDHTEQGFEAPLVIFSGNGYQVLPSFPLLRITHNNRDIIKTSLTNFTQHIIKNYSNNKVKIDDVSDLPRIARVPGTLNLKVEPKLAKIVANRNAKPDELLLDHIMLHGTQQERETRGFTKGQRIDWIDRLLEGRYKTDGRFRLLDLVFIPYLVNIVWEDEDTIIEKMREVFDGHIPDKRIRGKIEHARRHDYQPCTLSKTLSLLSNDVPEISELLKGYEHDNKPLVEKLSYPTKHLSKFENLDNAVGLISTSYFPFKKMLWYQTFSLPIKQNQIYIGNISDDLRIHAINVMPTSKGKDNLKHISREIVKRLGYSYELPTSLHPEQLIGKVVPYKDKGSKEILYRPIKGFFDNDWVLINEAKPLISSNDLKYTESRGYITQGLDPYPKNEVQKRSVDIEKKHALKYTPSCIMTLFVQPYSFHEETILSGFLRRFSCIYSQRLLKDANLDISIRRLTGNKIDLDTLLPSIINHLKEMEKKLKGKDFTFSDNAFQTVLTLWPLLIKYLQAHSRKGSKYINLVEQHLLNKFVKFCGIHAGSKLRCVVEPEDVEYAFIDFFELMVHELEYINNCIIGEFDYGIQWKGARNNDKELLKYLVEHGATSENKSNVTIDDFKTHIQNTLHVEDRQSGRVLSNLEDNGWIKKKQVGQHSSKVWITFDPSIEPEKIAKEIRLDKYLEFCDKSELIDTSKQMDLRVVRMDRVDTQTHVSNGSEMKPHYIILAEERLGHGSVSRQDMEEWLIVKLGNSAKEALEYWLPDFKRWGINYDETKQEFKRENSEFKG